MDPTVLQRYKNSRYVVSGSSDFTRGAAANTAERARGAKYFGNFSFLVSLLFFAIFEKMTTFATDSVVWGALVARDERESGERPELFLQL